MLNWLLGISPEVARDQIRDRDEFYNANTTPMLMIEPVAIEKVERGIFATEEKQVVDYVANNGIHYTFVYTHATREWILRLVSGFARDVAHPLNWFDAAHITRMIREHDIEHQWRNAKHGPSSDS